MIDDLYYYHYFTMSLFSVLSTVVFYCSLWFHLYSGLALTQECLLVCVVFVYTQWIATHLKILECNGLGPMAHYCPSA